MLNHNRDKVNRKRRNKVRVSVEIKISNDIREHSRHSNQSHD